MITFVTQMKKHRKNILAIGLLLLFTFGGVGVPIHQVYCHCKDQLVASLACPDDPCQSGGCLDASGATDCADCKIIYLKADLSLVLTKEKSLITTKALIPMLSFPPLPKVKSTSSQILPDNFLSLHRPSGNDLLSVIQVFLC
ncbi:MAG: hypothetical protein Kow0027_17750 [Saprospiraceae bacterium]